MQELQPGEVHIWTARVEAPEMPVPALERILSAEERDKAYRFHFEKHRRAYIVAHAMLRNVLSRDLHQPPEEIRFERNIYGKPFVVADSVDIPPAFNLSHSGSVVLLGITSGRRIGVDIEEIRPVADLLNIARSHFTAKECDFILHHLPESQERAFFRCWTRKEAYIKAIGKGLSVPLNTFDTSMEAGQLEKQLPRTLDAPEVEGWRLKDLIVSAGYLGAVAVETGIDRLIYREWSPPAEAA